MDFNDLFSLMLLHFAFLGLSFISCICFNIIMRYFSSYCYRRVIKVDTSMNYLHAFLITTYNAFAC